MQLTYTQSLKNYVPSANQNVYPSPPCPKVPKGGNCEPEQDIHSHFGSESPCRTRRRSQSDASQFSGSVVFDQILVDEALAWQVQREYDEVLARELQDAEDAQLLYDMQDLDQ